MRKTVLLSFLLSLVATVAAAEGPQRDLLVEVRQVEDAQAGYVVSTRPAPALLPPQQQRVRNGAQLRLSYGRNVPLQWVRSVQAAGPMAGAGVTQSLIWLQAGHALTLKPRWPGGKQPVTVEIEVQGAAIEPDPAGGLPAQQRSELATTVQAPMGEWITIARTGQEPPRGTYSSESASQRPRLLQLRVSLP